MKNLTQKAFNLIRAVLIIILILLLILAVWWIFDEFVAAPDLENGFGNDSNNEIRKDVIPQKIDIEDSINSPHARL